MAIELIGVRNTIHAAIIFSEILLISAVASLCVYSEFTCSVLFDCLARSSDGKDTSCTMRCLVNQLNVLVLSHDIYIKPKSYTLELLVKLVV